MEMTTAAQDTREISGEDQEKQINKQNFHVLAVDDSPIDRILLQKLLKISSYQVTLVESGEKALEYLGLPDNETADDCSSLSSSSASSPSSQLPLQEGPLVDLIMTDYSMPGMSGYDLLRRVKESSWKDVPVVMMSSEDMPSRISMCLEGGAKEFLVKPIQLSDVEKLQPHLDNLSNIHHENTKQSKDNGVSKRKTTSLESSDKRPKSRKVNIHLNLDT